MKVPLVLGKTLTRKSSPTFLSPEKRHLNHQSLLTPGHPISTDLTMTLKWPEMTFDFRIGKKKLGISEVVVGRPLFILNEIYSTEKTYVNNLNALVTVYQEPMQGMIF